VLSSERLTVSLADLGTCWTLDDLNQANAVIDMFEELEALQAERQEAQAQRDRS
jgi:hypothetical protein